MAGSLASERTHLVPTMQSFLAALFFLVFTVAQVREGAALDVGVSAGLLVGQERALALDLAGSASEQASAAEALGVELILARWEPRLMQVSDPTGSVRAEVLALEAVGLQ